MSKTRVLRKGESLPFSFDRGEESTDGYICTLNVKQFPGDVASISRVIALSTNSITGKQEWAGFITSTESDALINSTSPNANLWWAIGVLTKSTTDEEEQIAQGSVRFSLTQAWA